LFFVHFAKLRFFRVEFPSYSLSAVKNLPKHHLRMQTESLPSQPTPASVRAPLAFLPLYLGATPDMRFSDSIRLFGQNAAAFLMVAFGLLFVLLNFLQGSMEFVGLNFSFIATGAMSLALATGGFRRTALTLLTVGSCMIFFFAAVALRNGMENYLLVTMAASLLLLDSPASRTAITGLNAAAYLYVKISLPENTGLIVPNAQYVLNIALFVLALAGLIEFFRVLNSDYLRELEKANASLAASNHAKEKLFSVIAHDLRGPVGNLKVSLEMLETGTLDSKEFSSLAHDLAFDVDRSYSCLENLLSWSATQLGGISTKPANLPVRDEVSEIARLAAFSFTGKGIQFVNEVPGEAVVLADRQHFHGILRNLLSNAVKFTPQGGRVEVHAKPMKGAWVVSVCDTGVGMSPEKVADLFAKQDVGSTPGTRDEKGLGLGLEICRQFVALNGGSITAESTLGTGTKIHVTLAAGTIAGGDTPPTA
jgi:two-component system, sensor histidine kinase and response regulator